MLANEHFTGCLDRRIKLIEKLDTEQRGSLNTPIYVHLEHEVWAHREDISAKDILTTQVNVNQSRREYIIRYRSDIDSSWRIKDGAQSLAIDGVLEIGRRRFLKLIALTGRVD